MTQLIYTGSVANLRLLADELRQDSDIAACCTVVVLEQERGQDSLYNAELAQIVISVASGVATKFITDAIQAAIDRARDRGPITPDQPDTGNTENREVVDSHNIDNPS